MHNKIEGTTTRVDMTIARLERQLAAARERKQRILKAKSAETAAFRLGCFFRHVKTYLQQPDVIDAFILKVDLIMKVVTDSKGVGYTEFKCSDVYKHMIEHINKGDTNE